MAQHFFYIASLVPNQRAASDIGTPMPFHTKFFVQLIGKLDLTSSTDRFKCGVRDQKYSLSL